MKIEVGKKYKNRLGEIIEISDNTNCEIFPYRRGNGWSYTESGRAWRYEISDDDLIEEYIEPKEERAMIDLSKVKAEDILINGLRVAMIIDRSKVCESFRANVFHRLMIIDCTGEVSYFSTNLGVSPHHSITLKPKKVKYLKPLHVVLADESFRVFMNFRGEPMLEVNNVTVNPDIYSLFGKPLDIKLPLEYAPEWIEERDEVK